MSYPDPSEPSRWLARHEGEPACCSDGCEYGAAVIIQGRGLCAIHGHEVIVAEQLLARAVSQADDRLAPA
ncbi:MAG TPA: hypothetical protein VFS62_16475 [Chloroflexota bacterium]|jgi:hypothetical protein|nr:hypothetical protein [Chloroflexota bacterium]